MYLGGNGSRLLVCSMESSLKTASESVLLKIAFEHGFQEAYLWKI